MEGVLLKPPLLNNITNEFVKDIANRKDVFADEDELQRYLEAKYLKNLPLEMGKKLFKSLWKFTFRLSNEDTKENLNINYKALKILYKKHRGDYRRLIEQESSYFSQISDDDARLTRLSDFLSRDLIAYGLLNDGARIPIKKYAESTLGRFVSAIYLSNTVREHVEKVKSRIEPNNIKFSSIGYPYWQLFVEYAEMHGEKNVALEFGIFLYCQSKTYDGADNYYETYVKPHLDSFNESHFLELFNGIENNHQAYGRRRAKEDHKTVKERADLVLGKKFNYSKYPNFFSTLE